LDGFGAKAYSKLGMQTDVLNADPHRLVLILFDGAIGAIHRAKGFLAQRLIAEKCEALLQAMRIVDAGLSASVNSSFAPEFAGRLTALYKYVLMRLARGNSHNDLQALEEAASVLADLRDAWVKIGPSTAIAYDGPSAHPEDRPAHGSPTQVAAQVLRAYRV